MLTTFREKLLSMLLPAVAILALYGLKFSDLHARQQSAQMGLTAAQGRVPPPVQVDAQQRQIADLNRQLAEIEKQKSGQDARWHELEGARKTDSLERIQTIEGVTTLLNRHSLVLQDGSPAESNDHAKLPKALEQVVKQLAEKGPELKPQLWRVRFTGSFADVLSALEELNDAEPLAIPIHLQMSEARLTTSTRSWTLYLWI